MTQRLCSVLVVWLLPLLACTLPTPGQLERDRVRENCDAALQRATRFERHVTETVVVQTTPRKNEQIPDEEVRCLCAQVEVGNPYGLQAGDKLSQADVRDRLQLRLDGTVLAVAHVSEELHPGLIWRNESWPEGVASTYPGPFAVCWGPVGLAPGVHEAEIAYTKTNDVVLQHHWTFEVLP